jgi:lycopene cyclase domain-containing protein
VQQLSYLLVLAACVLGTLPLEFALSARVYRRWQRALLAVLPVAAVFVVWDYLAVGAGWWFFDSHYLVGLFAGRLPIEELLFFLVVPICGILTFEAVRHLRPDWAQRS